ncbi:MAG: hypothetical protein IJA61_02380 [Clostridia bacterium]|nr:hypothetical protein [Clostridia bacterium]
MEKEMIELYWRNLKEDKEFDLKKAMKNIPIEYIEEDMRELFKFIMDIKD